MLKNYMCIVTFVGPTHGPNPGSCLKIKGIIDIVRVWAKHVLIEKNWNLV